jgi:hypothetical protein
LRSIIVIDDTLAMRASSLLAVLPFLPSITGGKPDLRMALVAMEMRRLPP